MRECYHSQEAAAMSQDSQPSGHKRVEAKKRKENKRHTSEVIWRYVKLKGRQRRDDSKASYG